MKTLLLALFITVLSFSFVQAQCPSGQMEVTLEISTDNWGYETYWNLVPTGNACGSGTLYSGGNIAQVGCLGGGQKNASAGNGYGNNTTITEGPWCLTAGAYYDIYLIDDFGDGGANVVVKVNGFEIIEFAASGSNTSLTFQVIEPPLLDLSTHHNLVFDFTVKGDVEITAEFMNEGQNDITSFDFNYSIDGGTTQTTALTGLNMPRGEELKFTHPVLWNANALGWFDVDVWVSNVNGQASDENSSNDHNLKPVSISDPQLNILHSYITEPYTIEEIANVTDQVDHPRDLDFHPQLSKKELWVANRGTENSGGSTVTINNAGESNQTEAYVQDGNAWHFMSLPTAIAFGDNGNWANSTGVLDANHNGGTFTGPALWSSDLSIYGIIGNPSTAEFNGSHLDMLHGSPYCMGIAHVEDNTYFVYDSYNNELVKYAFNGDHGPGKDDHDNGEVYRYSEVFVERDGIEIPNHMIVDKQTGWMYISDHKNSRVLRMDINSGTITNPNLPLINETLAVHAAITGVDFGTYISSGITTPCGIDLIGTKLIVGDYSNGNILMYDISTATPSLLTTINTGATGLMGLKIGPDGRIWYVDAEANTVNKINVTAVIDTATSILDQELAGRVSVYPNPTTDRVNVILPSENYSEFEINIYNALGARIAGYLRIQENELSINLSNFETGVYFLEVKTESSKTVKKIVKK